MTPKTDLFVGISASYSPAYLNRIFSTLGPSNTLGSPLGPVYHGGFSRSDYRRRPEQRAFACVRRNGQPHAQGHPPGQCHPHWRRSIHPVCPGSAYDPRFKGVRGRWVTTRIQSIATTTSDWATNTARRTIRRRWTRPNMGSTLGSDTPTSGPKPAVHSLPSVPVPVRCGSRLGLFATQPRRANSTAAYCLMPRLNLPVRWRRSSAWLAGALLDHQIGRTWTLHGGAHRDVAYIEALPNPVFTNTLDLSTSGYLTPAST